jgi:hypothetical protein
MTPYRVGAVDDGIVVTLRPSTWWLRLRVNLQAFVRRCPIVIGTAAMMGLVVVLLAKLVWDGPGYAAFVLWVELAAVGGMLAIGCAIACARSLVRPAAEAGMPRQITFRARTLVVQPRDGAPFETNWTWIQRASGNADAVDLVISESPRRVLHVRRAQLGDDNFATLGAWLTKQQRFA